MADDDTTNVNPLVVVGATLTLILTGLSLVLGTIFLPTILFLTLCPFKIPFLVAVAIVQTIHVIQLWQNPEHLAFYRWLSLPIRRMLLPVVMLVCRLDAVKDGEATLYLPADDLQLDSLMGKERDGLLMTFRQSVRRRHRGMGQLFVRNKISRKSLFSESKLRACDVVPLIWTHEKRQVKQNGKNLIEEFIKRVLVILVVPDGILDLYYEPSQPHKPIAVQMSILQGDVYHWFMYFSADSATKSGIWFQGILLAMTRGVVMPNVRFVNAQCHHADSKRNAGFLPAMPDETNLLKELYPWAYTQQFPPNIVAYAGWENNGELIS